ncbi:MAG: hypothetical protein VCB42_02695, partial [Myxococcota bacterium]
RSRAEAELLAEGAGDEAQLRVLDTATESGGGAPSTVVDLSGEYPEVLRMGALDLDPVVWLESRGLGTRGAT